MLYLGYDLLRYVLIYKLDEVSFNFHLTFLQLNVIKMFTVQEKLLFTLLSAIFFLPLKVRVIGSRLYLSFPYHYTDLSFAWINDSLVAR